MLYGLTTVVTSTTRRACTARINFFAMSMQHCHTFTCQGLANGHNSLSLLCSYSNTNACRVFRALSFCIIPCNESARGVLLARVTSFAGGYKSPAQNLFLCLRLDQRSVDWHPGHAFHVQQRLSQREREDSFEDVQNCTGVFFTAVHLPAVDNSFMLTGDLRSLMCRAVVE